MVNHSSCGPPMKLFLLIAVLLPQVFAVCSSQQDLFFVDDFTVDASLFVIVPSTPSFPIIRSVQTPSSSIIGGERDMFFQINGASGSSVLINSVTGGQYTISTSIGATSFTKLTYDGVDGSSNLNPSGLSTTPLKDWTANCGSALRLSLNTDFQVSVTLNVYSGSLASVCTATRTIPASNDPAIQTFAFGTDWTGNCDFSNVGALEITFDVPDSVDIAVQFISIYGGLPSVCASPGGPVTRRFFVDDFTVDASLFVIVPSTPTFPITQSVQTQSSSIIGGERDLFLQVNTASASTVIVNSVSGDEYTISTPNGANGFTKLTYDGVDGSTTLNPGGLFSSPLKDWTANCGSALRLSIRTDIPASATLKVYSGSLASVCTATLTLTVSADPIIYTLDFDSDWSGTCAFSNVGALEITFNVPDNLDIAVQFISVYAQVLPTPSRTPSRTPTPTRTPSRTPSPTRSVTHTPTASHTPARSITPTRSATRPPSITPSNTATRTPARSTTPTRTIARSPSPTRTPARSHTPTRTPSRT